MKRLLVLCGLVALLVVPAAYARAGASMTLDQSNPVFGQEITFSVVIRDAPYAEIVDCSQNSSFDTTHGGRVYEQYFDGLTAASPKPIFTLSGPTWTGGAAACRADLVTNGGNGPRILASVFFNVSA